VIIALKRMPEPVPKYIILSLVLILSGATLAVVHRMMVNANCSTGLRSLFLALSCITGAAGILLLAIEPYRKKIRYNEKQKKIFWIYILGMGGLIAFSTVLTIFF
jgi:uncharacterized membrane protein YdcZ (DUF606 family)